MPDFDEGICFRLLSVTSHKRQSMSVLNLISINYILKLRMN